MPPELNIRRFKGLRLYYPKSEKATDELAAADNVIFDREGVLLNRPGFRHREELVPAAPAGATLNTGDPLVMYPAPSTQTNYMIFQKSDKVWLSDGAAPWSLLAGGAATIGTNEAVVYDGNIYFANGQWFDGTAGTVAAHPGAPVNRESIIVHKDRIFSTTRNNNISAPDSYRVYFTEPGIPDTGAYPAANFIDVRTGTPNRALISYRDQVYIFKPDSVWVLSTGGLPANWTLRKLTDRGCVGGPCVYNNALYWVGQMGLFRYDGVSVQRLSDPIQDYFVANKISYDDTCQVVGYDGSLYIKFRLETGVPAMLVYNLKLNAWSTITLPFGSKIGRMLVIEERSGMNGDNWGAGVYFGSGDDAGMKAIHKPHLWKFDPLLYQDETEVDVLTDFSIKVETGQMDFDEPHKKKRVSLATVEGMFDHLTVDQYDEENRTKQKVFAGLDESKVQLLKFPGIGYCRSVRFKFTGVANPGGIKLLGLRAEVKPHGREAAQQVGEYANQP